MTQKDIEGATQVGETFYVISSLSQTNEDTHDFRVLSALEIDGERNLVVSERYVYARELMLETLRDHFTDAAWYSRVAPTFGKLGGLNVEGLSASHHGDQSLIIGLRSPLWSERFGATSFGDGFTLEQGNALLVELNNPFSNNLTTQVYELDLNGHGIRGMEYIPALQGYIIIGGPVETSDHFSLWFYSPANEKVTSLVVSEFEQLCRPESVLHIPSERAVVILSEESGTLCKDVKNTYLKLTY